MAIRKRIIQPPKEAPQPNLTKRIELMNKIKTDIKLPDSTTFGYFSYAQLLKIHTWITANKKQLKTKV